MAGKGVKFTFEVSASNYSAGAQKVIAFNRQIANSAKEAGHATVSSMQASSASLRLLEGGLNNNLRAAERFISTIPGVGAALTAAFPVVGLIAVAGLFVRAGEKAAEFISHVRGIPNAINVGVGSIAASMQQTNDELQVSIDKLENANSKLEHRPENGLKLALDEASVSADKLAGKLRADNTELTELLKKQSYGGFAAFVLGGRSTTASDKAQSDYANKVQAIQTGADDKRYGANGDASKLTSINAQEERDLRAAAIAEVNAAQAILDANRRRDEQNILQVGSHDAEDASARARLSVAKRQVVGIDLSQQLDTAQGQNDSDIASKDSRQQAAEAAKKAAEAQMKSFQEALAQMKIEFAKNVGGDLPVQTEIEFWTRMQAATQKGGENFLTIEKTLASEMEATAKSRAEQRKKEHDAYLKDQAETISMGNELPRIGAELIKAQNEVQDKAAEQSAKSFNLAATMADVQQTNNQAMVEASLRVQEATGVLSAHDAAIKQQTIHTDEYTAALKRLRDEQNNLLAHPLSDGSKQADRLSANALAQDKLTGAYNAQSVGDQAAIAATTVGGRWAATLNSMTNEFTDFAGSLATIFKNSIASINAELVTVLTGKHENSRTISRQFDLIGRQIGGSVVGAGLQGAEGEALSALGFGSGGKMGTQGNPLYVRIAGSAANAGSAASGLLGKAGGWLSHLFGGGASSGGGLTSADIGLGGLASDFSNLPMLASGGPLSSNQLSIVGEQGPELFMSNSSGYVVPNHALSNGDTHNHYNIDASGHSDSAAQIIAIKRALHQTAQHSVKSSVKAINERARRTPSHAR